MFTEEETLIGGIDNNCIVQLTNLFEIIHQATDVFVHCQCGSQIIAHILLVFPTDQLFAFQVALTIFCDTLCIHRIPFVLYFGRHTFVHTVKTVGSIFQHFFTSQQFEIPVVSQSMFDRHILFTSRSSTSFVVVEQVGRFGKGSIVEDTQIAGSRHPVAVRCFLMIHHAERFALVAAFEEFDGFICDNVCCISFFNDMFTVFPEVRIVIVALFMLTAKDAPMVETLRLTDKVPLADHGSLISGLLKKLWKCLLVTVESAGIIGKAVLVTEFTGQDTST